jgi:hypothetical protein
MTHRFLWLLVPVAAGLGYWSSPSATADASKEGAPSRNADTRITPRVRQLEQAGSLELAELLVQYLAMPPGSDRDLALRLLCARWAEVDPAGALGTLASAKAPAELRHRLLTEWALLDSDAAWAAIPDSPAGNNERAVISGMLLHEDADVFMVWFRRTRSPVPDGDPAWLRVEERHGKELGEIAAAMSKSEPTHPTLQGLLAVLARAHVTQDPEGTLKWASDLPANLRKAAMRAALDEWGQKAPVEVWKRIADDKTGDLAKVSGDISGADSVRGGILKRLIKENPHGAMQLVLSTSGTDPHAYTVAEQCFKEAVGDALASGRMNGIDAYRLIASAKGTASIIGLNAFSNLWDGMSADGLAQTLRDVMAEPADHNKGLALGGIASSWAEKDPAAAMAFLSQIQDPAMKAEAYAGGLRERNGGHIDPQQQAEFFSRIPEEDRAMVFATALGRYGEQQAGDDPGLSAAPQFHPELLAPLFAGLPASDALIESASLVALRWGEQDPKSALAWTMELKDPDARNAAYASAMDGWAFHDPYAAGTWLAAQAKGPDRDAATLPLIQHLSRSDAPMAWEWAESVGDPALRRDARVSALRAWAAVDSAAAQSAYQKIATKLTPADAAKLSTCFSAP